MKQLKYSETKSCYDFKCLLCSLYYEKLSLKVSCPETESGRVGPGFDATFNWVICRPAAFILVSLSLSPAKTFTLYSLKLDTLFIIQQVLDWTFFTPVLQFIKVGRNNASWTVFARNKCTMRELQIQLLFLFQGSCGFLGVIKKQKVGNKLKKEIDVDFWYAAGAWLESLTQQNIARTNGDYTKFIGPLNKIKPQYKWETSKSIH